VGFRCRYANGVELICRTSTFQAVGVRFEGAEGWIQTGYGGFFCQPESLKTTVIGPGETHLYESSDHYRNFLDCVKNRSEPAAPVEVGHRSATVCHLGNIAMLLKKKLAWDPLAERFTNSDQANRMLDRPRTSPWKI
jgi:hypothetical protein